MKKTSPPSMIEARYRQRAASAGAILKWPAIGALIGGGVLLIGRLVGPSIAKDLGANAGEGFARGMFEARKQIASIKQSLDISGWGTYRRP